MEFIELKMELQEFVKEAEESAINSIQERMEFFPYIYLGNKKINKIISDSINDAIETAIEEIEDIDEETVVLVFKDVIRLNDGEYDSIVSQIYNIDEDSAYSFGLLYKIVNDKISFLNKRVFLGEVRNALVY